MARSCSRREQEQAGASEHHAHIRVVAGLDHQEQRPVPDDTEGGEQQGSADGRQMRFGDGERAKKQRVDVGGHRGVDHQSGHVG